MPSGEGHLADKTPQDRLHEEVRLLAGAAQLTAASLHYEATLQHVVELLVPSRADWAFVDMLTADGEHFERVAVRAHHPDAADVARALRRVYPLRSESGRSVEAAIREGRTQLLRRTDDTLLRGVARDEEHLRAARAIDGRSAITAPLVIRGRPIGALTLIACDRAYDEPDARLVEQFALAAACAIDNARLFHTEAQARGRLERMQAVVAALSRSSTAAEVASVACRIGAESMAAHAGALWLLQEDGSLLLAGTWGTDEAFMDRFRTIAPGSDAPAQRVVCSGEPVWVETERDYERASPGIYAVAKAAGHLSAYGVVPMIGVQRPLGVISFAHRLPHPYDADERAFYVALGQYCAQALERACLFDQHRRSEEQLCAAIETAPTAMIMVDERGRIVLANAHVQAVFGYAPGEIVGEPLQKLIPERARDRHPAHHASFFADRRTRPMGAGRDLSGLRKDGTEVAVEVGLTPFDMADGEVVLASIVDVSERLAQKRHIQRLYEEAEAGRQHLLEASRVKDEFLAIVSHELRTPLNALLGWSSMLRSNQGVDAKRAIEVIERNARALTALVEDLLDASRVVMGKLRIDPKAIDAAEVLRSALSVVAPMATAKGVAIDAAVEADPCALCGDADRLQQVFWNLLSNAIKFTPRGGRVHVRLARAAGARVELTVADTGRGIAPDFLPLVFERFRQADTSMTRIERGLGLGLSIARHIVELHDGTIGAQSPGEGKGATFTVSLPASSGA